MKKNIGTPDRIVRLIFAVALLGLSVWRHSWILGAASAFVFFEAIYGWCVLYQILGKNSCPINKK